MRPTTFARKSMILTAAGALVLGPAVGMATAASAEGSVQNAPDVTTAGISTYTLAHDGACVGQITFTLTPAGQPGSMTVRPEAELYGLPGCSVTAKLSWTDADNGQAGAFTQRLNGPGTYTAQSSVIRVPRANLNLTLTTDAPNMAGTGHVAA